MTCQQCNSPLSNDAAFCPRCGASVEDLPSLSSGYGKLSATSAPRAAASSVPPAEPRAKPATNFQLRREPPSDSGFKTYVVIACICCVIGIPVLWCVIFANGPEHVSIWGLGIAVVGTIVLGSMAGHYCRYWRSACPKCDRWGAAREIESELVDRQYRTDDVEREVKHWSRDGQLLGTSIRMEAVSKTVEHHRVYYRCRFCRHEWDQIERSEA